MTTWRARRGTKVPNRTARSTPRRWPGRRPWWSVGVGGLVAVVLSAPLGPPAHATSEAGPHGPDPVVGHHGALPDGVIDPSQARTDGPGARGPRRHGVVLGKPVVTDPDRVRLRGRTGARRVVVLQVRRDGRWVRAGRTRSGARGGFSFGRSLSTRSTLVRARAQGGVSRSHRLPARTTEQPPTEQPPTEEPTVEPTDGRRDECGVRPTKDDGTRWSCTLAEDFDGSTLDRSLWLPAKDVAAEHYCLVDDPSTVDVSGGALHLTVRDVARPVTCGDKTYTTVAGQVSTWHTFSQQYGRFEARMRVEKSAVAGLHEAFWLWPDDRVVETWRWPASGEIDIVETYSQHPDLAIPFLHYTPYDNWGPYPGVNTAWDCISPRGQWHTYTLEWTDTRLEILVDGKTCLVNTSNDPAFDAPYIMALSQFLGVAGNERRPGTPVPATTDVDYVRVWK